MTGQPLVLIVDDEPNFREIFSAKLTAEGFRTDTAENGELGVAKAKQIKPDLILMDVRMPVMDGAAAVLKLREDPDLAKTRVVFLTSLGDPRGELQEMSQKFAKDFGAQAYIKKTDDLDAFAQKVKSFFT